MEYYAAPLEGLTGYIYRRAHHDFFPGICKYYTPFIMPGQKTLLRSREARDVLPENNAGIHVVPQVLTNQADDFLNTASALRDMGYDEINLNLGCPSGTVVSKHRGAGFLSLPEQLDRFLNDIFASSPLPISIKTRIGVESSAEFPAIMEIYARYPICQLTVHARIQRQKYSGSPDLDAFAYAVSKSSCPVCYNGDLFSTGDINRILSRFQTVQAVMLGRGLIADPGLHLRCFGQTYDAALLRRFHDRLIGDFTDLGIGERNVLYRMKEIWFYMVHMFPDSARFAKAINKSQHMSDYLSAVDALFAGRELTPAGSSFAGTP